MRGEATGDQAGPPPAPGCPCLCCPGRGQPAGARGPRHGRVWSLRHLSDRRRRVLEPAHDHLEHADPGGELLGPAELEQPPDVLLGLRQRLGHGVLLRQWRVCHRPVAARALRQADLPALPLPRGPAEHPDAVQQPPRRRSLHDDDVHRQRRLRHLQRRHGSHVEHPGGLGPLRHRRVRPPQRDHRLLVEHHERRWRGDARPVPSHAPQHHPRRRLPDVLHLPLARPEHPEGRRRGSVRRPR